MVEFCIQELSFEEATPPALAASAWVPPQFTIIRPWVINFSLSSNHVAALDVQSENTYKNMEPQTLEKLSIFYT